MTPNPDHVHTTTDLASALKELSGERSYSELNRAARPYRLASSTLTDMFGKGRPSEETLEVFLRACGLSREDREAWRQARERALSTKPELDGVVRVAQADPRRLGVHAPIDAPGATEDLPVYVRRDVDDGPRGVRDLVRRAAQRGGLVVLVGGSSVGKTRCAYEALRALLPQWWLLQPPDARKIEQATVSGSERLVVWLDELQRYLDSSNPLTAATVRTLLDRRTVMIATLWPDRYNAYTSLPQVGHPEASANARELLGLAEVVHIDAQLSQAERERAHATATAGDARIKLGLEFGDYGLFQVIAAAPQLVDRWRGADAYAAAVLTAAVDATRLGVRSPLNAELLREAAPGYCDARQRGAAPANWFEASLAYLTQELHGAAAALAPSAPPAAMGSPAGYEVADYLQQRIEALRYRAVIPATTWRALVTRLTDSDDQIRIIEAAVDRLLFDYALQLWRRGCHALPSYTANTLIEVLMAQERENDLHAIAARDPYTAMLLADKLVGQGRVDDALAVLSPHADAESGTSADHQYAAEKFVHLLGENGREDVLRIRADAGDRFAADKLARLLAAQGREDALRSRADESDPYAADRLADLLVRRGHLEEAIALLRPHTHYPFAAGHLAKLLDMWGQEEKAVELLTAHADAGITFIAQQLAGLLFMRGREEELRARADGGDKAARARMAMFLAMRGRVEELSARAEAGDGYAADRLADLLADQGELNGLHARADAGNLHAAERLADLLAAQGREDGLRTRADAGDLHASARLADLLIAQERIEELHARADAGDLSAALRVAVRLAERGQVEELRARADGGDWYAADQLADLLAEQTRTDELRTRAEAGDRFAARRLADALARAGHQFDAERVRRFGLVLDDISPLSDRRS
ncbi:hypothetical protein [Nonomuraea polychroma]|nr:hypothetical protein [Nonomuraea polychroma]